MTTATAQRLEDLAECLGFASIEDMVDSYREAVCGGEYPRDFSINQALFCAALVADRIGTDSEGLSSDIASLEEHVTRRFGHMPHRVQAGRRG